MHIVLIVAAQFCCMSVSASAQQYFSVARLGMDLTLASRPHDMGDGTWLVADNPQHGEERELWRLQDRLRCERVGMIPRDFKDAMAEMMCFTRTGVWVGATDKLAFSSDFTTWTEIDLKEAGREVESVAISPFADTTVVVANHSYIVRKRDTLSGIRTTWIADSRNRIELVTPRTRRLLYADSNTSRHRLSNIVKFGDNGLIVGISRSHASKYCMAVISLDGSVRYISAPPGVPSNGFTSYLHGTASGDYYGFYYDGAEHYCIVYHARTETVEYIDLSKYGRVGHATSIGDLIILSVRNGLALIKGTSTWSVPLTDTIVYNGGGKDPYPMDATGATLINSDTIMVSSMSGLMLLPVSTFNTVSVENSEPGVQLNQSSNILRNLVDGTTTVTWQVFDISGRALLSGLLSPGERDLSLPLAGVASGGYHLRLTADGRTLRTQPLLVTH